MDYETRICSSCTGLGYLANCRRSVRRTRPGRTGRGTGRTSGGFAGRLGNRLLGMALQEVWRILPIASSSPSEETAQKSTYDTTVFPPPQ